MRLEKIAHYPYIFKIPFRTLFVQGFICQMEDMQAGDVGIESFQ